MLRHPATLVLSLSLLAACPKPAPAPTTPPPASAAAADGGDRDNAVAAVSVRLSADLGVPAVVAAPEVDLEEGFAFVLGRITAPDGSPVDIGQTNRKAEFADGAWEDMVVALVKKEGASWTILEFAAGCTDVCWLGWADKHGSPVGGMPDAE